MSCLAMLNDRVLKSLDLRINRRKILQILLYSTKIFVCHFYWIWEKSKAIELKKKKKKSSSLNFANLIGAVMIVKQLLVPIN